MFLVQTTTTPRRARPRSRWESPQASKLSTLPSGRAAVLESWRSFMVRVGLWSIGHGDDLDHEVDVGYQDIVNLLTNFFNFIYLFAIVIYDITLNCCLC